MGGPADLRLVVLGAGPSFPNPGGACSGYLVESGDTRILLDCGSGVLGNLRLHTDYRRLDAVVITHMHADHFFDLIPLRYGLKYGPGEQSAEPMKLFLPPDGERVITEIAAYVDGNRDFFREFFDVTEYEPRSSVRIGAVEVTFAPVCHFIAANGVIIRGERTLAYSSDSGPCEGLRLLAKDSDLFLCEASLPESYEGGQGYGHMRGSDAGRLAADAGVKRLLLTHTWDGYEPELLVAAAAREFGRPVERAVEGMIVEL